ncbi:MAG: TadE-like protein [Acidimicrobiaceae bacterium]|nr:MAG: TadE-like protein [Acidimicrobiaceae bacterium]
MNSRVSTDSRDAGVVTAVEMMYLLVFLLVALVFFAFLGRLHAAGVQVSNTAQSAARAASLTADSTTGAQAAQQAVDDSTLSSRCTTPPTASLSWQGGAVTVTVTCQIANAGLTGIWTPGRRTVAVRDTQPIDRYKR